MSDTELGELLKAVGWADADADKAERQLPRYTALPRYGPRAVYDMMKDVELPRAKCLDVVIMKACYEDWKLTEAITTGRPGVFHDDFDEDYWNSFVDTYAAHTGGIEVPTAATATATTGATATATAGPAATDTASGTTSGTPGTGAFASFKVNARCWIEQSLSYHTVLYLCSKRSNGLLKYKLNSVQFNRCFPIVLSKRKLYQKSSSCTRRRLGISTDAQ